MLPERGGVSVELPPALAEAVEHLLADASPRDLARSSADLSARYREKRPRGLPVARSQADLLAYMAARLPATYAAVSGVLGAVQEQRPTWSPRSIIDLGAGPGTAIWSAAGRWPGIERAVAVEVEPKMLMLGRQLAQAGTHPAVRAATWIQADVAARADVVASTPDTASAQTADLGGPFDLVVLAYVLGELPPDRLVAAVARAAEATAPDGVTVIVEPGTPEGYGRIISARSQLLDSGGHVTAPCPHDDPCPIAENDWCHFSVRLSRTAGHRIAKGGALGYEDEKFAYVAVTNGPTAQAAARIIRHPQTRPRLIQLELCTPAGLVSRTVTKSERDGFRAARKAAWGDAWSGE
jgi:ribosomal protein RSM22 (predicted rRNA methylase)